MSDSRFQIFVGVDWGSEEHAVCALDSDRQVLLERTVEHEAEAINGFANELIALAGGQLERLVVALELPRGTIVDTLLARGVAVFAINPKQLDRFRDRHTAAGAKDDRRDAFVLADSIRTDEPAFHQVKLGDARLVQLRELSRVHDDLKAERIALGNRLREQLHRYFPQILDLGSVHEGRWIWALLEQAPSPEKAHKLSLSKLRSILKTHRIRAKTAEEAQEILRKPALHVAPGVVEASCRHIALLLPRLKLAHEQQMEVEREIDRLLSVLADAPEGKSEHRDVRLLLSLPGVGKLVCAAMLSEAWEPLETRDYQRLRALCGSAPITRRSGKQFAVMMRYACNGRLREALHYWAGNAIKKDPRAKEHYARLRSRGHRHARALRGVGDRLLKLLVAILESGVPYDATRRVALQPA